MGLLKGPTGGGHLEVRFLGEPKDDAGGHRPLGMGLLKGPTGGGHLEVRFLGKPEDDAGNADVVQHVVVRAKKNRNKILFETFNPDL